MMHLKERLLGLVALALALLVAGPVRAEPSGQDHLSLDSVGRTRDYTVQVYTFDSWANVVGESPATDPTNGFESGMIVLNTNGFQDGAHVDTLTSTPTYTYPLPYPTRVAYGIYDVGVDGTPSCTSLVIRGRDWRGFSRKETFSLVNETERYSDYSYEIITSWTLSGCTGTDADDDFIMRASKYVAMPVQIRSASRIVVACSVACTSDTACSVDEDSPNCLPGSSLTYHALSNSVDVTGLVEEEENCRLYFRVRGGW